VSINVDVAVAVGVSVGVSVKVNVGVCVDISTVTRGIYSLVAVGDKNVALGGSVRVSVKVGTGKDTSNAAPTITRFTAMAASRIAPMIRRGGI